MVRQRPYTGGAYIAIAEPALIALLSTVRVYAMASWVDMRKGFEGLYALATQQMGREVLRGDLFLLWDRLGSAPRCCTSTGPDCVFCTSG